MTEVTAGQIFSFEVTFDSPALDVGMVVMDDSGPFPVQVGGVIAMLNTFGNTYRGKFTPVAGKNYIVHKYVFTDGTFTTLADDESGGSESFYCKAPPQDLSAADLEGSVDDVSEIGGTLDDGEQIAGTLEDQDIIE